MFLCFTPATVDTADILQWTCLLKLSGKISQSPGKHFNLKSAFLLHTMKFAYCLTHSHRVFLFVFPLLPTLNCVFPGVFIFPWIVKPRHLNSSFFFFHSFHPANKQKGKIVSTSEQIFTTNLKCLKLMISNTRSNSLWCAEKEGFSHSYLYLFQFLS